MKILRIYCKNCDNQGHIDHPKLMTCPFCDGVGSKDIKYETTDSQKSRGRDA